jgi:hypothetical protein
MLKTITEFAQELGIHKSTVSRTLKKIGIQLDGKNGQAKMLDENAQLAIRQALNHIDVKVPTEIISSTQESGLVHMKKESYSLASFGSIEDVSLTLPVLDTSILTTETDKLASDNTELEQMLWQAAEHFGKLEATAMITQAQNHKERVKRQQLATKISEINQAKGL